MSRYANEKVDLNEYKTVLKTLNPVKITVTYMEAYFCNKRKKQRAFCHNYDMKNQYCDSYNFDEKKSNNIFSISVFVIIMTEIGE